MIVLKVGALAQERGMSILDLAETAGIAYNTAKALYKGHTVRIDLPTLERVCAALKVSPGDVFSVIETTPSEDSTKIKHALHAAG